MFLRAPHNYDVDAVSAEFGIAIDESESVVQQQFAAECDINEIVRRFGLTGELPSNVRMPVSGDFQDIEDFQSAMLRVREAQEAFMQLPGEVRARFAHDPQRLMAFLEDGSNRDEAIKLGLVVPPPEVTRDAVKAIDELAARFPELAKG
ncbi:MAG: internal scaffolding protein [Arizlama microvirus]|nr:MAG: internal scaffolding protein [Arizlama microvirus]